MSLFWKLRYACWMYKKAKIPWFEAWDMAGCAYQEIDNYDDLSPEKAAYEDFTAWPDY